MKAFDQKDKAALKSQIEQLEQQCHNANVQLSKERYVQEEKNSQINLLLERLNQVADRDMELDRILEYTNDINKINMVYVPFEGDKIDKQLADTINHQHKNCDLLNKAKLLFVREAEGVYTYCKKKVYIMINEKDNLIVRVGGGYMSLEQFIESYNPFQCWKPKLSRNESNDKINRNTSMCNSR